MATLPINRMKEDELPSEIAGLKSSLRGIRERFKEIFSQPKSWENDRLMESLESDARGLESRIAQCKRRLDDLRQEKLA